MSKKNDCQYNSNKCKRNKKSKRYVWRIFIVYLIGLCLAISFTANHILSTTDKQVIIPLESNLDINYDFTLPMMQYADESHIYTRNSNDGINSSEDNTWYLILVNRWNPIPDDYEVELTELANGQLVDKRIYPALQAMFDAAKTYGIYPVVASGYRTADTQQSLLDQKIAEYIAKGYSNSKARMKAEEWVAIPGTSEHQLGIAVDINADGIHSSGYEVYDWLSQNAHKYGFICRYPADKTEITGVIGEAWHYRYVGKEDAAKIYRQGVCLEEYLNSPYKRSIAD